MIFNLHDGKRPLTDEIRDAERLLAQRKHQLHDQVDSLGTALRRGATSPSTLLWSVGVGFAFGELTRKRAPQSNHSQHAHADDAHESAQSPGTLQLLLRYLAIARPIMASASSFLAPFLHRAANEEIANQDAEVQKEAAREDQRAAAAHAGTADSVTGQAA
ncbi:MAG: hypothetical protein JWL63_1769 [Rhodocyclales bacterium]|nr:hypothetical protein [Rhodocyclales bacterium]